jgi:NDP-sugar pyrophosphorylase family protein
VSELRHALVLSAGLGTRLRPLTLVRAKPAIPVAGIPLIRRIMKWAAARGVAEAVVNLHHLPSTITKVVGDGADIGLHVRYSWEQPLVLGSAGGPRLALPLIDAPTFLIVNGDTLADVDVDALLRLHRSTGALVTLALTANREFLRYGGLLVDDSSRVTGRVRPGPLAAGSLHFVGVQVVEARAFGGLQAGEVADSIGGLYDRLVAEQPGSVAGFVSNLTFFDIGTVSDYVATSAALGGSAEPSFGSAPRIDPTARVLRSILWEHIDIGATASIEDCIVTDGVRVPPGSTYRQSILMDGPAGVVSVPKVEEQRGALRADPV